MENAVVVTREGRSLEETPTLLVASVTTVLVFLCFMLHTSIYQFGKWLKKTRSKALFAALEKIKEELMLLGLISLMLGQCSSWISQICVNSSLFSSRFYLCSEEDYAANDKLLFTKFISSLNETVISSGGFNHASFHQCGEGREPFVSIEGLEQLHRFVFVLGITHVLYSCIAVGLAMSKIYSWKKWENQAILALDADLQARVNKVMRRQSTFVSHHASHPWSRSRVLIWMLCFLRQFKSSIQKSDYLALRSGFIRKHKLPHSYNFQRYMVRSMEDGFNGIVGISYPLWAYTILCILVNVHGLNIYFWLSFMPAILVMLVGTKLQHVVSVLALETVEPNGHFAGIQLKLRDDLFWFRKPEILFQLIQCISFQNAFEMATYVWSLWGFKQHSWLMKNHAMSLFRLICGVLIQFWCSYSTVPLNVLVTQMGSKCEKAVIAASVRESLHNWCERVKERSTQDALHSITTRSTCSLGSTIEERDEIITIKSGTPSRCSSAGMFDLVEANVITTQQQQIHYDIPLPPRNEYSSKITENLLRNLNHSSLESLENGAEGNLRGGGEEKVETLVDLFRRT